MSAAVAVDDDAHWHESLYLRRHFVAVLSLLMATGNSSFFVVVVEDAEESLSTAVDCVPSMKSLETCSQ